MSETVAECLLKAIEGDMPKEALDAFLTAQLVGIGKQDGGTRVLGQGCIARRKVGRAIVAACAEALQDAVGERQFGLRKDGANALHRLITAHVAMHPGTGVVGEDMTDAFSKVKREVALDAMEKHCPIFHPMVLGWYDHSAKHVVPGPAGEAPSRIDQHEGLDQGCPASPAGHSVTARDPLRSYRKKA